MSIIPRATQLREHADAYITDVRSIFEEKLAKATASTSFLEIYHLSLSTDTVLRGLASPKLQPRLGAARTIVVRLPLLVSIGQLSVAMVELRRFVELLFWTIYFSDHPVEWGSFKMESEAGFSQDTRKPISHSANRELAYYVNYARELMSSDESGLAIRAVDAVKHVSHALNAGVHAGQMARAGIRKAPHEDISELALRKFSDIERRVFSNCSVVLAAYRRSKFDRLNAAARAHFDWLVGGVTRKQIRQGPFGRGDT